MEYRRIGRAGLRISTLSFGSWVTYHNQVDQAAAVEMMAAAYDAGVNFFDNAEGYAAGQSEDVMGQALRARLAAPELRRLDQVLLGPGPQRRRHQPQGHAQPQVPDAGHRRVAEALRLEHIDLVFCHRPDPHTPVEETVRAMSDMITQGKALYWGTSEWSAADIRAAWEIAERHHLHKPVVEQPQYHLFHRQRVEQEYAPLYDDIGLGLTTWSPLASGLLTGKYKRRRAAGQPRRAARAWASCAGLTDAAKNAAVVQLGSIAAELDATTAQLALAWVTKNPHVSSVITGASKLSQLQSNLGAMAVADTADARGDGAHRYDLPAAGRSEGPEPQSFSAASRSAVPTSVHCPLPARHRGGLRASLRSSSGRSGSLLAERKPANSAASNSPTLAQVKRGTASGVTQACGIDAEVAPRGAAARSAPATGGQLAAGKAPHRRCGAKSKPGSEDVARDDPEGRVADSQGSAFFDAAGRFQRPAVVAAFVRVVDRHAPAFAVAERGDELSLQPGGVDHHLLHATARQASRCHSIKALPRTAAAASACGRSAAAAARRGRRPG
jgi:voltage-dependent potassium channel beta subunit